MAQLGHLKKVAKSGMFAQAQSRSLLLTLAHELHDPDHGVLRRLRHGDAHCVVRHGDARLRHGDARLRCYADVRRLRRLRRPRPDGCRHGEQSCFFEWWCVFVYVCMCVCVCVFSINSLSVYVCLPPVRMCAHVCVSVSGVCAPTWPGASFWGYPFFRPGI